MKTIAVILAGGRGERFWPKSRAKHPKQFLSLTDDGKTMIQKTASRLLPLVSNDDMYIATNKYLLKLAQAQLPEIPAENFLTEPAAKNTAPCIGFAAAVITRKYEDAVMIVLPSDHIIKSEKKFIDTLNLAIQTAKENKNLVTIGITPSYPETGYGYINYDNESGYNGFYKVKQFVEKPDIKTAERYLSTGQYLWNSGIFIWKLSTILEKFKELLPDIYNGVIKIGEAYKTPQFEQVLKNCFDEFRSESVDYGIMERADHIYTIPGDFGWDDAGNWLAIERLNKTDENGNVEKGDVISVNTKKSIIIGENKLIAAVGLENVIIVDTKDAILICAKEAAANIKEVIKKLELSKRIELQ
jgi:mannose-1-phosphate guanylyltransferase